MTLIAASAPISTLIVGAFFFGARIVRHQWLGATISASGVVRVVAGLAYVAILPSLVADWCWETAGWRAPAPFCP
ncbi:MAG: hypothetical protein RR758_06890 [Burkholderiaceae bacterium]